MNKTILKILMIFCLVVSCKTKETQENCELFRIGNNKFYNPRIYEHPVIFEKGNHALLHNEYVPLWYPGYCAVNLPSYFDTKENYLKHISAKEAKRFSIDHFERIYEANKENTKGLKGDTHEGFHLLFRGTVSVKNLASGNEYLLVAGKNYISQESDYDKNTEYYEGDVKDMLAFILEEDVYKSVHIDYVVGDFTKEQYNKVFDVLNSKTLVNTSCFENVNTLKDPNFNSSELPKWVYNKSELDEFED